MLSKNVLLNGTAQTLGAGVSAQSVTNEFAITNFGALNFRVELVADTVTAGTGITWKLQTYAGVNKDGAANWVDSSGNVTIAAAGTTHLALNVQDVTNDEQYLPLRPKGRVVVTTGTGSAVTIEQVYIVQGE